MKADPRAVEQLRQEREAFEQAKSQAARWFRLRLVMGYGCLGLLALIAAAATFIVLSPAGYSDGTVTLLAATLFVDVIAMIGSIFKLVLPQGSAAQLGPLTTVRH